VRGVEGGKGEGFGGGFLDAGGGFLGVSIFRGGGVERLFFILFLESRVCDK